MCHSRFQACQRDTSGSNCAGVSSGDQQKYHSALGPTGSIVPRHDKKIPHKAMSAFDTPYQKLLTEQLPAGYLKWLGVEAQWRFSDTWGILAQRQMSGPGVMGCWTSQTMQNAAVCFEEGHQKPLLQSTCWRVLFQVCKSNVKIRLLKRSCVKPGSTICPPVFGGEMEVAACSFPESKQIEGPRGPSKQYEAKAWIYALWSICPWSGSRMPNLSAPTDTKNMCRIKLQASTPLFISQNPTSGVDSWCWAPFWNCCFSLHVQPPFLIKAHSTLTKPPQTLESVLSTSPTVLPLSPKRLSLPRRTNRHQQTDWWSMNFIYYALWGTSYTWNSLIWQWHNASHLGHQHTWY